MGESVVKRAEDLCSMNFFEFTKSDYEYICEECMLSDEYRELLRMEIQDYTRPQMADKLGISVDTLDKMIAKLKKKIKKILWKTYKNLTNQSSFFMQ